MKIKYSDGPNRTTFKISTTWYNFNTVQSFDYFGVLIMNNNVEGDEIDKRIAREAKVLEL